MATDDPTIRIGVAKDHSFCVVYDIEKGRKGEDQDRESLRVLLEDLDADMLAESAYLYASDKADIMDQVAEFDPIFKKGDRWAVFPVDPKLVFGRDTKGDLLV